MTVCWSSFRLAYPGSPSSLPQLAMFIGAVLPQLGSYPLASYSKHWKMACFRQTGGDFLVDDPCSNSGDSHVVAPPDSPRLWSRGLAGAGVGLDPPIHDPWSKIKGVGMCKGPCISDFWTAKCTRQEEVKDLVSKSLQVAYRSNPCCLTFVGSTVSTLSPHDAYHTVTRGGHL